MEKTYSITVPTTGYQIYEVDAVSESDAIEKLKEFFERGHRGKGICRVEESSGDEQPSDTWEVEE